MTITLEEVQRVISKNLSKPEYSHVISISETQNEDSYSRTRNNATYMVDLAASAESIHTHTCSITISFASESTPAYHPNSLQTFAQLIAMIQKQTSIPIAEPILDTSLSVISHPYLLTPPQPLQSSSIIPLSIARSQNLLTAPQEAFIDLSLGQLLGQLHSGVQNDWFGRPSTSQPDEPSYSWQQTFVELLEPLIEWAQETNVDLGVSYEDLRRYLSRAIAFFLFDDVEVPSLVWFTGSEDDIYITRPNDNSPSVQIAVILPNLAHALWGDPLLETFFLPPAPSEAVKEGYSGGGGEPLLVFARQKTKRLWYTVFLALVILVEREGESQKDAVQNKRAWALETLKRCTDALKDAPCY
ncbi:hypothetical protein BT96DRAFT_1017523 [Gymnopus androsaceus JB14]|uniref:Aminoglycoside phosphotransferase domain-containing protein n=1 Tax=Gymnopus androsaceus JB14 TaxID=1447944 RepID=A0A6A4HZE3_9AGAR|nr:hypothetical protein BT96DRAFT_1017523 [Gymnopus androsaceus JB14]